MLRERLRKAKEEAHNKIGMQSLFSLCGNRHLSEIGRKVFLWDNIVQEQFNPERPNTLFDLSSIFIRICRVEELRLTVNNSHAFLRVIFFDFGGEFCSDWIW
jgi:hypothetical protein